VDLARLRRFLKDRSVAKLIEYSLIAVAIGTAVAAAILNFWDPEQDVKRSLSALPHSSAPMRLRLAGFAWGALT